MKKKMGVPTSRPVADFLPTISIKAKDFAAEMTNVNVQQKDLYGEGQISNEHIENNKAVRQMMIQRGIIPENLLPAKDVEKVWQVTKLFLERGYVSADKDLKIAYNKNLRNAELKQFMLNIVKYNKKENLDVESYLITVFEEWFTDKKENISKNYNVLPKDSIVSKDGVEADLEQLGRVVRTSIFT